MKRLVIATVLFLLIVLICFTGNYTVLNRISNFKSDIENCERLYLSGKVEDAKICIRDFKDEWYKTSKIISAFTNHRPIDDISILVSTLPAAASAKDDFEFTSITKRIKTELKIMYKEQSLYLENLY